jgi:hypothetical protein
LTVSSDFAFTGWGYGVMCFVIGSLAIIGAVVFAIVTYQDSKKKRSKPNVSSFKKKKSAH